MYIIYTVYIAAAKRAAVLSAKEKAEEDNVGLYMYCMYVCICISLYLTIYRAQH